VVHLSFFGRRKVYPDGARRRWRNFLIRPIRTQLEICFLSFVLSIGFAALITFAMNQEAQELRNATFQGQTDFSFLSPRLMWMYVGIIVLFFALSFTTLIIFTHRIMGPAYACRRHIQKLLQGDFTTRTRLRKTDSLCELANDLNKLSEYLATHGSISVRE
jgi:signal transduction histidine kinase